MMNLDDKLSLSRGRPTGFDYLRIALSVSVIGLHSALTSYGVSADGLVWASSARGLVGMVLPMFFALSGFLVAGSLLRTSTLVQFLGLRAIRIYPALAVEVVLSALILGPILTTVPLAHYFFSSTFGLYLLNVTGHIHYMLPGVFHANPYPNTVNGQLWTVPYELLCYLVLAAVALLGVKTRHWIAPTALAALMVVYLASRFVKFHTVLAHPLGVATGTELICAFLAGVSLYLYRSRLPWSPLLCAVSGVASAVLLSVVPYGNYFAAPVLAYFTISLGLFNPVKLSILRGADYSYGIYLYGFVIQQTLMAIFPWAREWWLNIALTVPVAAVIAAFSWHFIEKPALELRRFLLPHKFPAAAAARGPLVSAMTPPVEQQG